MTARLLRLQSNSMAVSRITFNRISPLRNTKWLHMGEHFTRGSLREIELKTAVPLAGRQYLVSSNSSGFPKHLSGPKEDFPLLVKAKKGREADMKHWALRCKEIIDQAYQRYVPTINIRLPG